jgi:hypothetical protein
MNQQTLGATDGATALDMNVEIQENKNAETEIKESGESIEVKNENQNIAAEDTAAENISLESATYLQNTENMLEEENMAKFEVDSIELATPQLFSDSSENNDLNQDNIEKNDINIFENSNNFEGNNNNLSENEKTGSTEP